MSGLLRVLGRGLSELSPRCGFGCGRDWSSGGAWSCPLPPIWLGLGLGPPPCGPAIRRDSQGGRCCPPKRQSRGPPGRGVAERAERVPAKLRVV